MAHDAPPHVVVPDSKNLKRRLALEVRSWRLGYAILEGRQVLDWGTSEYAPGDPAKAARKMRSLTRTFAPTLSIMRSPRTAEDGTTDKAARVLSAIRKELEDCSVRSIVLPREVVFNHFAQLGIRKKLDIAAAVAKAVPELQPRLPLPRKPWHPERRIMPVFDAVATVLAYDALQATDTQEA
jgi:hypothetical protein